MYRREERHILPTENHYAVEQKAYLGLYRAGLPMQPPVYVSHARPEDPSYPIRVWGWLGLYNDEETIGGKQQPKETSSRQTRLYPSFWIKT